MKVYEVICNYNKDNKEIYCINECYNYNGNLYKEYCQALKELENNIEFQTTCVNDEENIWEIEMLDDISQFNSDLYNPKIIGKVVAYYMIGAKSEYKNDLEIKEALKEEKESNNIQYVEYIIEREVL